MPAIGIVGWDFAGADGSETLLKTGEDLFLVNQHEFFVEEAKVDFRVDFGESRESCRKGTANVIRAAESVVGITTHFINMDFSIVVLSLISTKTFELIPPPTPTSKR